jgi:hypothetical protein
VQYSDIRTHEHQYSVRFEVFTEVTMKNVVFWDIKTQFVLHRRHITSSLQSLAGNCYVRSEVFTAVAMKNVVFWDIKPRSYFTGDTLRLRYRAQLVNAITALTMKNGVFWDVTPCGSCKNRRFFVACVGC